MIQAFVDSLRLRNLAENTIKAYRYDIQDFVTTQGIQSPNDLHPDQAKTYLETLQRARKYTATAINRKIAALRKFYAFYNKRANVQCQKQGQPLPRFIESSEVLSLLSEIKNSLLLKPLLRDRAYTIVRLLFSTMLRVSELADLQWTSINWVQSSLRITGKGRKERIVLMDAETTSHLLTIFQSRPVSSYVVVNHLGKKASVRTIESTLNQVRRELHLSYKLTPHVLRHSGATALLEQGMPLSSIADLLGHENMNLTRIYAKLSMRGTRAAYDQCHPLSTSSSHEN